MKINKKFTKGILSYIPLFYIILSVLVCGFHYIKDLQTSNFKDNELSAVFFDVGQADSCYIRLPGGENLLIDAGEDSTASGKLASLGVKKLDYVILTHPHSDHVGGMSYVLEAFEVNKIYMPNAVNTSSYFEKLIDFIDKKGIEVIEAKKGMAIYDKNNVIIEILSPDEKGFKDLNNMSAVIKITYGDISYLFMGDAEKEAEQKLGDSIKNCQVLKIGHHGSSTSTTQAFLNKVNPQYGIISVGKFNDYNHPSQTVLNRLNKKNVQILRTDMDGDIYVFTDGYNINYKTQKENAK